MFGIIFFIFTIGIIVLVHEFGHLIMAKRNGVYCHEFSIGMGPKIVQLYKDKSGTVYNVRMIPVGGYVMMSGEDSGNPKDENIPDELKLDNKKPWAKTKILVAGSFMNMVLAIFIMFIIGFFGGTVDQNDTYIKVVDDMPLSETSIQTGDKIVSINGDEVLDQATLMNAIAESEPTIAIDYIDSDTNTEESITVNKNEEGFIGIRGYSDKYELISSFIYGVTATWALLISVIVGLVMLFTPAYGMQDLAGPIGIMSISSDVASLGVMSMLNWVAYLSVNIGLVNMMPIPALDGGRMLFVIYEAIFRRKAPKKVEQGFLMVGVVILLGLFILVTFNDIMRLI